MSIKIEDVMKARHRLCAAAPDLLAELIRVKNWLESIKANESMTGIHTVVAADYPSIVAAIAKATTPEPTS